MGAWKERKPCPSLGTNAGAYGALLGNKSCLHAGPHIYVPPGSQTGTQQTDLGADKLGISSSRPEQAPPGSRLGAVSLVQAPADTLSLSASQAYHPRVPFWGVWKCLAWHTRCHRTHWKSLCQRNFLPRGSRFPFWVGTQGLRTHTCRAPRTKVLSHQRRF